jgi:integrase
MAGQKLFMSEAILPRRAHLSIRTTGQRRITVSKQYPIYNLQTIPLPVHISATSVPQNGQKGDEEQVNSLEINRIVMEQVPKINPPFATTLDKGLIIKPFRFLSDNSATTMPLPYIDFKPPRLVKAANRWYVEYWYRTPELLHEEIKKDWVRFRVFEEINRVKTDEYANLLLLWVERGLRNGYNPFDKFKRAFQIKQKENEPDAAPAQWSLNIALDQFILYCTDKGLRPKTIQTYASPINSVKAYFLKDNAIYQPVTLFTKQAFKDYFKDCRKSQGWENGTANNYLTNLNVFFNWLVKEDRLEKNPLKGIEYLPVNITKHKYYDNATAERLKVALKEGNPELYQFCEFIYYTATRPQSEARLLQVKHILFERNLLFVPASISKNKIDDYIPMSENLVTMLQDRVGQPANNFIFGGAKPHSKNLFTQQYKPFKKKLGLGEEFSLYGWKHTRAIDLANAGANPYDIMRLFRHQSLEITMSYLRDLGIQPSGINEKTKKF